MISLFSDLKYKEIIDVHTGFRVGYVSDAELEDSDGHMISLIVPGRAKLFGLLGREDDYVIPFSSIMRVGSDIILVENSETIPRRKVRKSSGFF